MTNSNLHVTKNYLSAVFKKQLGKTVTEFIHEVRMDKAIFLLNSGDSFVMRFAVCVGYDSFFLIANFANFGIDKSQKRHGRAARADRPTHTYFFYNIFHCFTPYLPIA